MSLESNYKLHDADCAAAKQSFDCCAAFAIAFVTLTLFCSAIYYFPFIFIYLHVFLYRRTIN